MSNQPPLPIKPEWSPATAAPGSPPVSSPRFGILGGTFNPVHHGHLVIAEQARQQLNLDGILWLPAGDPPHKPLAPGATTAQRLAMVQLAIATHRQFHWSALELQRPGHSYAVDTLEVLHQQAPTTQWYWIIGADAMADLPKWHRAADLVKLCHWLVAPRPSIPHLQDVLAAVRAHLPLQATPLLAPPIEISSTLIRQQLQAGQSVRYLVPTAVGDYIDTHQLYRGSPDL